MNKSNKRALVKDTSQVDIFMKTNFFIWIINIYQFHAKRVNSKINWIYIYKIKFTNEKKMQNFEQKIIEVYFVLRSELYRSTSRSLTDQARSMNRFIWSRWGRQSWHFLTVDLVEQIGLLKYIYVAFYHCK